MKKTPKTQDMVRKTFDLIERKTIDPEAGIYEAMISTEDVDRQGDIVRADGVDLRNYDKNPIVLFGHNYSDPSAVIARTIEIEKMPKKGIRARWQFAPRGVNPVADMVRGLWDAEILNATSIGFIPKRAQEIKGGYDFIESELLEYSLVSLPANQNATRLMYKSLADELDFLARNLADQDPAPDPEPAPDDVPAESAAHDDLPVSRSWVRRATIDNGDVEADYLIGYYMRTVDVPEDATVMQQDTVTGEGCKEVPHPDAGTTVTFKDAVFIPPLEMSFKFDHDKVFMIERRDCSDEDLIKHPNGLWEVRNLSDAIASLPIVKGFIPLAGGFSPVEIVTGKVLEKAADFARRVHRFVGTSEAIDKAGRTLSRKNENKIRSARDNLNEVLAEVEQQPEGDGYDAPVNALGVPCPYCDKTNFAPSWGMYSCEKCHGTFEVVSRDGARALFPDGYEVLAVEEGTLALKGAIPPHTTPMADPGMAWDGAAAVRECPAERAALRRMHAWVDSEGDQNAKSSYKLPHHLVNGEVVLRGVNNAKARLSNTDIPAGDKPGVERHLDRHAAQFEKSIALRDMARALNEAADELDGDQHLSDEDEQALVRELHNLVTTFKEVIA